MIERKGAIGLILFFIALLLILVIGFMAVMITGVVTYTSDQITPIMNDLGNVEDVANFSQVSEYTFTQADRFVQTIPWLVGLSYVAMLIFSVFFVITFADKPHPFLLGLYFFLVVLLVMGAVIMSNMYEDIYTGTDELALELQSQTMMSFMILHSPYILAFIAIISGILLFGLRGTDDLGGGF